MAAASRPCSNPPAARRVAALSATRPEAASQPPLEGTPPGSGRAAQFSTRKPSAPPAPKSISPRGRLPGMGLPEGRRPTTGKVKGGSLPPTERYWASSGSPQHTLWGRPGTRKAAEGRPQRMAIERGPCRPAHGALPSQCLITNSSARVSFPVSGSAADRLPAVRSSRLLQQAPSRHEKSR